MDVGFIGLGKMGIAMARNIAKAATEAPVERRALRIGQAASASLGIGSVPAIDYAFQMRRPAETDAFRLPKFILLKRGALSLSTGLLHL